jgi:hypothetical protein
MHGVVRELPGVTVSEPGVGRCPSLPRGTLPSRAPGEAAGRARNRRGLTHRPPA